MILTLKGILTPHNHTFSAFTPV